MPTRTKFQGWENPQSFEDFEREQARKDLEDVRRVLAGQRPGMPISLRKWLGIVGVLGFLWGFFFFVIGPLIHRVLSRLGWWQ